MEKPNFSLVLRVKDLQKCREFYRDVLQLGSPVLDTPFWVEFQMCETGKLCLESCGEQSRETNAPSSAVWMMEAEEELAEQLTAAGYREQEQKTVSVDGYPVTAFHDPEGNIFYLTVKNTD